MKIDKEELKIVRAFIRKWERQALNEIKILGYKNYDKHIIQNLHWLSTIHNSMMSELIQFSENENIVPLEYKDSLNNCLDNIINNYSKISMILYKHNKKTNKNIKH